MLNLHGSCGAGTLHRSPSGKLERCVRCAALVHARLLRQFFFSREKWCAFLDSHFQVDLTVCCWCIYLPCSRLHRLSCCRPCTIVLRCGCVFFFDPHTKQHSFSGFVLIPCSRKTHLNLFIDKTAIVFRSVGHLWACARQKPRRAMQCLALSWPRKGATVFRIPVSQCWSVGILVARLLRFKDAKPCCRGAACNQCADLLVEGPAFARATSALLGHTWAAKFWRNRKYPG